MWSEGFQKYDTEEILRQVIPNDETFHRAWFLVYISAETDNQPQERMVLLTDTCFHRVRFNHQTEKIIGKPVRIPLEDISLIEMGFIQQEGETVSNMYGFRMSCKEPDVSTVVQRIYRPPDQLGASSKELMEVISNQLYKMRLRIVKDPIKEKEILKTVGSIVIPGKGLINMINRWKRSSTLNPAEISDLTKSTGPTRRRGIQSEYFDSPRNLLSVSTGALKPDESTPSGSPPVSKNFLQSPETAHHPGHKRTQSATVSSPKDDLPDRDTPLSQSHSIEKASHIDDSMLHRTASMRVPTSEKTSFMRRSNTELQLDTPRDPMGNPISSSPSSPLPTLPPFLENKSKSMGALGNFKSQVENLSDLSDFDFQVEGGRGLVDYYYSKLNAYMNALGYFLPGAILAYIFGYWGWSVLWLLAILWALNSIHKSRIRQYKSRMSPEIKTPRENVREQRPEKLIASDLETEFEECLWFNVLTSQLWPKFRGNLAVSVHETLQASLDKFLTRVQHEIPDSIFSITPYIHDIRIIEVDLGPYPPNFRAVSGAKPSFPDYVLEFELDYRDRTHPSKLGEFSGGFIKAKIVLGNQDFQVDLPLHFQELSVKGRLRVGLMFFQQSPFLHTLSCSFMQIPQAGMTVKPLTAFEISHLPFAKEWIQNAVNTLLKSALVFPEQINMSHHQLFGTSVTATDTNKKDPSQQDVIRHQSAVEKSQREGLYSGLLHVKVMEGRQLQQQYMPGQSQPYCLLSVGDQLSQTHAVKKSKNPTWNYFCEMLVTKSFDKILELNVISQDDSGKPGFLGTGKLNFSEFGSGTEDVWLQLWREKVMTGEIHLQVRYVIPERYEEI
eukprot:TRINITY_DN3985_c0_g2_i1.p1 TRINITY_DN3985_c0_g2~~TRINITY_DN3985_c0_g2_i1.p1  ORF type:complete len:846 (-),score=225.50 TRINITY_DN3985_c0_g2_i1:22-2538(-)